VDGVLVGAKSLFWVKFCHRGELKFEIDHKNVFFESSNGQISKFIFKKLPCFYFKF
jgi:hypothetical protein